MIFPAENPKFPTGSPGHLRILRGTFGRFGRGGLTRGVGVWRVETPNVCGMDGFPTF